MFSTFFDLTRSKVDVVNAERIHDRRSDDSKYLVMTRDLATGEERVFENTDSLIEGKFDSSDHQARFAAAQTAGATCKVRVYGWRIPLFSMYQNVVDVECQQKAEAGK